MDDLLPKLIAAVVVIGAVIFDWPRALAGLFVGIAGRKSGYPWITIPAGVAAVAALGEVVYPLIGRTAGLSWGSFWWGIIAAGATAIGLFRVLWGIGENVEGG